MDMRRIVRTAALVVGGACLIPLALFHHERSEGSGGYREHTGLGLHPYDWLSWDKERVETRQTLPDGRTSSSMTYQHSEVVNFLSLPMQGLVLGLLLFALALRLRPRSPSPPTA